VQKIGSSTTSSSQQQDKMREKINHRMDKIKHKLIIISGKGGVGKSMVAVNLAYGLLKCMKNSNELALQNG